MGIESKIKFELVGETELTFNQGKIEKVLNNWQSKDGPPIPVVIEKEVWDILVNAVINTPDSANHPRVFRLYMKRGKPRHVIKTSEIEEVWLNARGIIRWKEGRYPSIKGPLRKGGNCFIRDDVELYLHDAWWMGRELTDLRILMSIEKNKTIVISAWWSRGDSSKNGTDGELWPVKLILKK